jgi:hypothetical protein
MHVQLDWWTSSWVASLFAASISGRGSLVALVSSPFTLADTHTTSSNTGRPKHYLPSIAIEKKEGKKPIGVSMTVTMRSSYRLVVVVAFCFLFLATDQVQDALETDGLAGLHAILSRSVSCCR